jgi:hypothetical protein
VRTKVSTIAVPLGDGVRAFLQAGRGHQRAVLGADVIHKREERATSSIVIARV